MAGKYRDAMADFLAEINANEQQALDASRPVARSKKSEPQRISQPIDENMGNSAINTLRAKVKRADQNVANIQKSRKNSRIFNAVESVGDFLPFLESTTERVKADRDATAQDVETDIQDILRSRKQIARDGGFGKGGYGAAVQRGLGNLQSMKGGLEAGLGIADEESIGDIIQGRARAKTAGARNRSEQEAYERFQAADGIIGSAREIFSNFRLLTNVAVESLPSSALPIVAGGAASVVGGLVGGPTGAQRAASVGTGLGSFVTEYGNTMLETFAENGVNLDDPNSIKAALSNKELMSDARARGARRGIAVGTFDAMSVALAGKMGGLPVANAVIGKSGSAGFARKTAGVLAGGAVETAGQGTLGALGEAAGQVAADGRITSPQDIVAEFAGEIPTGAVESSFGTAMELRKEAKANDPNRRENSDLASWIYAREQANAGGQNDNTPAGGGALADPNTTMRVAGFTMTPTQLLEFAETNTSNPRIADIMSQPVLDTVKADQVARILNEQEAALVEPEAVRRISSLIGGTIPTSQSRQFITEELSKIADEVVEASATLTAIRDTVATEKSGKQFVGTLRGIVENYSPSAKQGEAFVGRPERFGQDSAVITQDQVSDEAQRERNAPYFLNPDVYGAELGGTEANLIGFENGKFRIQYDSPTEVGRDGSPVMVSEDVDRNAILTPDALEAQRNAPQNPNRLPVVTQSGQVNQQQPNVEGLVEGQIAQLQAQVEQGQLPAPTGTTAALPAPVSAAPTQQALPAATQQAAPTQTALPAPAEQQALPAPTQQEAAPIQLPAPAQDTQTDLQPNVEGIVQAAPPQPATPTQAALPAPTAAPAALPAEDTARPTRKEPERRVGDEKGGKPEDTDVQETSYSARTGEATNDVSDNAATDIDYDAKIEGFLQKIAAKGRQGKVIAARLRTLLDNRSFNAAQKYYAFRMGEVLAVILPKGANVDIDFVSVLFAKDKKAAENSGTTEGSETGGSYTRRKETSAGGFRGLITLSLAPSMMSATRENSAHEAFHVIQDILKAHYPEAFALLNNTFKDGMTLNELDPSIVRKLKTLSHKGNVSVFDDLKAVFGEDQTFSANEAQAIAFGALMDAKERGQSMKGLKATYIRLVDMLSDFRRAMGNLLRKEGIQSPADILTYYASGKPQESMTEAAPLLGEIGDAAEATQYSGRVGDKEGSGFERAVEGRRGVRASAATSDVTVTKAELVSIKQAVSTFAAANPDIKKDVLEQTAERELRRRKAQVPVDAEGMPNAPDEGGTGGFREIEVNGAKGVVITQLTKPSAKVPLEGIDEDIAALVVGYRDRLIAAHAEKLAAWNQRLASNPDMKAKAPKAPEFDAENTTPREMREAGVSEEWIRDHATLITFAFKKLDYSFANAVDGEKLLDEQSTVSFKTTVDELPLVLRLAVEGRRREKIDENNAKREAIRKENETANTKKSLPAPPTFEDTVTASELRDAGRRADVSAEVEDHLTRPTVLTEKGVEVADRMSERLAQDIRDIIKIAKAAEKKKPENRTPTEVTAMRIVEQKKWYSKMQQLLRKIFGSMGDIVADVLGATSARTPVATNYAQTIEAIELWSRGNYDTVLDEYKAYRDGGGGPMSYEGELALRDGGKKYNANTMSVMDALVGLFREKSSPKTPNYAMNLIGAIRDATIDVWAARALDRIRNHLYADAKMIPPAAEQAVKGEVKRGSFGRGTTKDFFFGQEVMRMAGEKVGMDPHEVQAFMWFFEKDVWTQHSLTSAIGEGGDIASVSENYPVNRVLAGVAPDTQGNPQEPVGMMAPVVAAARGLASLRGLVNTTAYGMYTAPDSRDVGYIENASNFEAIIDANAPQQDINTLAAEILKVAKAQDQSDAFVAMTMPDNDAKAAHARPAMTAYFKSPMKFEAVKKLIGKIATDNIGGFTAFTDPQSNGDIRGMRFVFMPEYIMEPEAVASMSEEELYSRIDIMRLNALDDMEALRRIFDRDSRIGSAVIEHFDVLNGSKETYDDTIRLLEGRNTARTETPTDQNADGEVWQQPIHRSVATRSERRLAAQGDQGNRDSGSEEVSLPILSALKAV